MEACLKEELPPASELEELLRNGVLLCKLAAIFAPDSVKVKSIYDLDMSVYKVGFPCLRSRATCSFTTKLCHVSKHPDQRAQVSTCRQCVPIHPRHGSHRVSQGTCFLFIRAFSFFIFHSCCLTLVARTTTPRSTTSTPTRTCPKPSTASTRSGARFSSLLLLLLPSCPLLISPPASFFFFSVVAVLNSWFLFQKGVTPAMENLHGVAEFTEEELSAMNQKIGETGVQMPKFDSIKPSVSPLIEDGPESADEQEPPEPYRIFWPFAPEPWEPWADEAQEETELLSELQKIRVKKSQEQLRREQQAAAVC